MEAPKKELSKLSRLQMLELLLAALQENEQLRAEVAELQSRLDSAASILDQATARVEMALAGARPLTGDQTPASEACDAGADGAAEA